MSTPSPSPSPSSQRAPEPQLEAKDLSVTALYTAQTWAWAGFQRAECFESDQSRAVFGATNLVLALVRFFTLTWRAPSLPKSLAQRHALIDLRLGALNPHEVVELAAGLSARGLRCCEHSSALPHLTRYLEVDQPHVIEHKRALLARSDATAQLPPPLVWEGADVTRTSLKALFEGSEGGRVIIAEGLMMYLSATEQRALWREAFEALSPTGGTLLFDLVPACEQAPPGLVGRGLERLMRAFTGGESFKTDTRTRADLMRELMEVGFHDVRVYDTPKVAQALGLPFAEARTEQLVFEASVRRA